MLYSYPSTAVCRGHKCSDSNRAQNMQLGTKADKATTTQRIQRWRRGTAEGGGVVVWGLRLSPPVGDWAGRCPNPSPPISPLYLNPSNRPPFQSSSSPVPVPLQPCRTGPKPDQPGQRSAEFVVRLPILRSYPGSLAAPTPSSIVRFPPWQQRPSLKDQSCASPGALLKDSNP